jgi:DegV family protein with EDD domain
MASVSVLTDSTASIPETMLKELNIYTVAYYIHKGQEVLRDLVTVHRTDFLEWLPTARELPKTASPGPGDYVEAYRQIANGGTSEIISIHMTSSGSGAYQAATIAQSILREEKPEVNIEVIDTRNVSLCQGLMVIEAARAALKGETLVDVVERVKRMIPVTRMIQTADTLKYLYMGGRIGKAKHIVASALNIKPLIGMEGGVIVPLGVARNRHQAFQMMVDKVQAAVGNGKIKIAYVHAGARQDVETLKHMLESRIDVVESFFAELSPALAVHTGPGTAGLCYSQLV